MLDRRFSRRATLKAAGGIALASALPTHAFAAAAANGPNVTPMPGIKGNLEMWDWSDAPSIPGEQAQAEFYTKFFPGCTRTCTSVTRSSVTLTCCRS